METELAARQLAGYYPSVMVATYHVGTSGWHYDEWAHGLFYPPDPPKGQWLQFYGGHVDTVEVNNTFYRLPKEDVAKGWAQQAPPGFLFTFKASKRITHERKLRDCEGSLEVFLSRVRSLGQWHIGSVLYQLPPYMQRDDALLEEFLQALPKDIMHAFEFRHRSWFDPDSLAILRHYGAGLCVHDMPQAECPVATTAGFAYFRLHGAGAATEGDYTDEKLVRRAERIRQASHDVKHVFVYFDNDEAGHALANAQTLRGLL